MHPKHLYYLIAMMVLVVLPSCSAQQNTASNPNTANSLESASKSTVAAAFADYWKHSAAGDFDGVERLIVQPPDKYHGCSGISRAECIETKMKEAARPRVPNMKELVIKVDNTIIREGIPSAINSGSWKSYKIGGVYEVADEGRLELTVDASGLIVRRDVLLFKTDDGWKIIEMVDPGDFEAWAPPPENDSQSEKVTKL